MRAGPRSTLGSTGGGAVASLAIAGSDEPRRIGERCSRAWSRPRQELKGSTRLSESPSTRSPVPNAAGFAGFYLFTDDENGKLINISLKALIASGRA